MDPVTFSLNEVIRFMIVLSRVGGIMVFAPLFSARAVPVQFKVVFSLVTTMALLPAASGIRLPADFGTYTLLSCVFSELLIGVVLGFVASFIFAAMQMAGQLISFNLGFAIINLVDPQSEVEVSVFGLLENFLGLMFFLLINGHHWFFMAVSESFKFLPVGGVALHGTLIQEIISLSSEVLVAGIQIAGPVLAVTIICDIVFGILGRVAPQIQILIIAMPFKILVGFACLSISFYFLPHLLGKMFAQLSRNLFSLIQALA